jgi:hypothetical protein
MYLDLRRNGFAGITPANPNFGLADVQSLADLSNSYSVVSEMHVIPFTWQDAVRLAVATAAPMIPLVLTILSVEELLGRLIEIMLRNAASWEPIRSLNTRWRFRLDLEDRCRRIQTSQVINVARHDDIIAFFGDDHNRRIDNIGCMVAPQSSPHDLERCSSSVLSRPLVLLRSAPMLPGCGRRARLHPQRPPGSERSCEPSMPDPAM